MTDYVALGPIYAPGSYAAGYQRGHAVPESVVENWDLRVGTDVAEGSELPDDVPAGSMERPGPEATRATWEKWAVANGMSAEDAAQAAQEALEKIEAASPSPAEPVADDTEQGEQPVRPADSAPKAEWITFVVASGGDERWANDSTTTKANLQAWQPPAGDTVAVAATEANQA
jgi:hypothetical protein